MNRDNKLNAIVRYLKWQIAASLNPEPSIHAFTNKSKLIVERGMSGATGNVHNGLHEFSDMAFLLHYLRPNDLFVDIGANVGSYTVLASAHVGARTISFEPAPVTFQRLNDNIAINHLYGKVQPIRAALGAAHGTVKFTVDLDCSNHVECRYDDNRQMELVEMMTLDEVLENEDPALLKIDVEGFETEVLSGANATLEKQSLKAIIIELNGAGRVYEHEESDINDLLLSKGFAPYKYNPVKRALTPAEFEMGFNSIYIRDIDFVNERIVHASKVRVLNKEI